MHALLPPSLLPGYNALQAGGFLVEGAARPLNAADGKACGQALANHLGKGRDLIEGLADLNDHFRKTDPRYRSEAFDFYGPWRLEGEKDVNSTLRSLGMYRERWGGNKELCLLHPLGNRSNPVIQAAELYVAGRNIIDLLSESVIWELVLPRLEIESFIVDLYLSRPDWLERLRPDFNPNGRTEHFAAVGRQNDRLKSALGVIAKYFQIP